MERAKIVMNRIDIQEFPSSIFFSNANLLAPVEIFAQDGFQDLRSFFEEEKRLDNLWLSFAGPIGVGQYSLKRDYPVGILARQDLYLRNPIYEEMEEDFKNFGEQVLGPAVNEVSEIERNGKYKSAPKFVVWNEEHYFTGPPRIVNLVFTSRVFQGQVPSKLTDLIDEVDFEAKTLYPNGEVVFQNYQLFHSSEGRVSYTSFRKLEEFNREMYCFGSVSFNNDKFMYNPTNKEHPKVDFTNHMIK